MTQMLRVVTAADEAAALELARARTALAPVSLPSPPPLVEPRAPITDEVAPIPAPAADAALATSWSGRLFALSLLVATIGGLGWLGREVYFVATDSWIAPLHLSPDSDGVAALRMQRQRQLAELARLDAEVTRIDGELTAINAAVVRLDKLRDHATTTRRWQTEASARTATGLDTATDLLRRQRGLLVQLGARQAELVTRARDDLAAGLIDRTALDREEQVRDQLALELTELDRQLAEAGTRTAETRSTLRALRGEDPDARRTMPELAASEEHTARVELEIERLRAEAVGQRALRAVAIDSAATQRELLAELEARPLYRAMTKATDIAFVPYDQLGSVGPGARIMDCLWGVFRCHQVGTITELVPGEVVTQDPWGKLARGQYVVLHLTDAGAVRERVLRVRR